MRFAPLVSPGLKYILRCPKAKLNQMAGNIFKTQASNSPSIGKALEHTIATLFFSLIVSIWLFSVVLCVIFMLSFLDLTAMWQKFKQELLQPCSSQHLLWTSGPQHHLGAYWKHRLSSHSPDTLSRNLYFNTILSDLNAHQSLRCSALQALQQKQPD